MRQVPEIKYSLIGSGRLARHLNFYFKNSGLKLSHWARNHDTRQKLPQLLATSDIILLAISDDAIENFVTENAAFLKDKTCVHFSGSVISEKAIGIHPLNTFSEELYSMDVYESTPMIVDCDSETISRIFPSLSNPVYFIEKEKKIIYHALVSMMGNFTNLLWKESIFELEKQTGLPKEILYAYQNQIFDNIKTNPINSLTGPFVRGDFGTIDKHKEVLSTTPLSELYQCFQNLYFKKNKTTADIKNNPPMEL